jgi:Lytic transglycolase/Expansin C-terminal domain
MTPFLPQGGAPDGMDPYSPSYGTSEGACGYGAISKDNWPYFSTAALSPSNEFFKSGPLQGCGQCYEITCDAGSSCKTDSSGKPLGVLVQITDKCPECGTDHIDMQALAFAKLADSALGRINIKYRRVECLVPEMVKVQVANFAGNGGWLSLQVTNVGGRGAVKEVYVKSSSAGESGWVKMNPTWGATFELSSAPSAPLDVRVVDDSGESVESTGVVSSAGISGKLFDFGKQFKITDPKATTVTSFEGGSDPMLVDCKTPGNDCGSGNRKLLGAL